MGRLSREKQLVILFAAIIIPSLFNIDVMGIHFTLYRVAIPLITILCVAVKNGNLTFETGMEKQYFITFAVWIGYGTALMLLRGGMNAGAIKELLGLCFGTFSIYSMVHLIGNSKERFLYAVGVIKILVAVCILLGLFEIISGIHLNSSIYSNPEFMKSQLERYGFVNINMATGFQYNPNDYASFLAFLAPLYLIPTGKKRRFLDWIMIGVIFLICAKNNATLCILALGVGFLLFILFARIPLTGKRMLVIGGVAAVAAGFVLFRMSGDIGESGYSLIFELKNHLHTYQLKQGSSYVRIMLYRDSLKALADSRFLGLGPSSFSAYFTEHPSVSKLVDPHNYWLEILTQYGIFVFLFFVFLLLQLFRKAKALYKREHCMEGLVLAVMFVDYIIIGLAPSSFINYTFQWIVVALTLALLRIYLPSEDKQSCPYAETIKHK